MSHDFCTDGFWSSILFNDPNHPIFTECFQYSVLIVPTVLLLVTYLPWLLFRGYRNSPAIMKIPLDHWYSLKMMSQILLAAALAIEIVLEKAYLKKEAGLDTLYILSYVGLCVSLGLTLTLTELRRRTMHPVCPILFVFWLFSTLAYVLRFYSNIIRLGQNDDHYTSVGILIISGLSMFLLLCNFIFDCFSRYTSLRSVLKKKSPCPEEYVSVLSQLTFFWMDSYIYKWYKHEMTEETAFDVRRNDEATRNTDTMERFFLKSLADRRKLIGQMSKMTAEVNTSERIPLTEDSKAKEDSDLNPGWTLFCTLVRIYMPALSIGWVFKAVQDVLLFAMPFLLKVLLDFVQDPKKPAWQGYCLAAVFFVTGFVSTITVNQCFFISSNVSIRIRAALIGLVYRKTLRLSNEHRSKFTSGEIVNLMSVDAERIMNWISYAWFIISSPLQICLALAFLYVELGYSIFAGIVLMLAFFPFNAIAVKFIQQFSDFELTWKDKRVKILAEILNGIKVLKMYAWEPSFNKKVTDLRDKEVKYIGYVAVGYGTISVVWDLIPYFVMLVTFLTYVYSDVSHIVTPEKAFVSLALFNLLRFPMIILPWGVTESINAFVSIKRIGQYLVGDEMDTTGIYRREDTSDDKSPRDVVIEIKDGFFSWKRDEKEVLKNINLEVTRGSLVAVVGKVGTGKSSLLSAILGEILKKNGTVTTMGRMAYVPQEAWIQNQTLKDNILFTKSYNATFYADVIEACCLTPDLEQLPAKDETEIGERGINLSGGQKQRVSMARAVYQNGDIYLLDDPLSAVDAHVGQHLFEKVISDRGILKGKTRILVTHGLNWLPKVDEVIVLDSEGHISERGSFKELVDSGKEFRRLIQEYMHQSVHQGKHEDTESDSLELEAQELLRRVSENPDEITKIITVSPQPMSPATKEAPFFRHRVSSETIGWRAKVPETASSAQDTGDETTLVTLSHRSSASHHRRPSSPLLETALARTDSFERPNGQLTDDEVAMTGTVHIGTYRMYILARGAIIFVLSMLAYAVFMASQVLGNMWLERFTSDRDILNASAWIATGNQSGKDKAVAMIRERTDYYMTYYGLIGVAQTVFVIFFWAGYTVGNVRASRFIHVRLLTAILHSPMSFFDTTPSGRTLNRFSRDMDLIDHTVSMNISDGISCFFSVLSSFVVIAIVTPWFLAVIVPIALIYYFIQLFYMPTSRQARRLDSIASSPLYSHFSETLQGAAVVRAFCEQNRFRRASQALVDRSTRFKFLQTSSGRWLSLRIDVLGGLLVTGAVLLAVEGRDRGLSAGMVGLSVTYSLQVTEVLNWLLKQLTELETNAVAIERVREYSSLPPEETEEKQMPNRVSPEWPQHGEVAFEHLGLRYRPGLPLVLRDVDVLLPAGQRVGVVGRTGAGKSSLSLAIFRLVEPAEGTVSIDGVDVRTVPLRNLRERLTILPQDPVIFCGTLRENLDPFQSHTDTDLLESLDRAHLSAWVASQEAGLDYECGEGGANLSTGQKQLVCLARAVLRRSKVLILDEATASVDVETDRLVMQTVRGHFADSTVIVIAHRINTILDTDNVMVLEQGHVVEFGSPGELLEVPGGVFRSLADQSHDDGM